MGEPAIGMKSTVVVDYEQSWGTAKSSPAGFKIGVASNDITPAQEFLDNPKLKGDFNPSDPVFGKKAASGPLVYVPDIVSLPWFIKLITGGLSSTGSTDYVHVGKLGSTSPLSAVVETSFDIGGTMRYSKATGARVNNLSFDFDSVGINQFTFDMAAKDVVPGSVVYSASPTDWTGGEPLNNLQLAGADFKVGGSAVGYIAKGSVSLNFNLSIDDYRVAADATRGSLVPQLASVGGSMTLVLDSVDVLTLLASGATPSSFEMKWTQAANKYVTFKVPRLFIQKTGPTLKGPGPVMVDVQWRGAYSTPDSTSFIWTIGNQTAGTVYV